MEQSYHYYNEENLNKHVRPIPWERLLLIGLLVLTGIAYIWGLGQSGWANSFYSAAVQAGTESWKAFFFGSFDSSNFITVDKPPASLWVMDLSARLFGVNSWSILVPEALEGVACVWMIYMAVRRWFSPLASLLAGTILALTPVAALMFRFNNPDALLVLLLTASAYTFTRALEAGKTKWLVWTSVLIGFGFLTKMLAAYFVIPVFVLVYMFFAPVSIRRRVIQILLSALTVIVSSGWWIAIVQLIPAAARPYIGSSQDNSILNLIFGYNGLGRLTGNESGMGGHPVGSVNAGFTGNSSGPPNGNFPGAEHNIPGHGGSPFGGQAGITRLFGSEMGGQISWLLPAALLFLIFSIWIIRHNWKRDRTLPALLIWSLTLIVTGVVFSFGSGIIHQYYTVALAPSIGALVGIGAEVLWKKREQFIARLGLGIATAVTAVWAYVLLSRTPGWLPWLPPAILFIGLCGAVALVIGSKINSKVTASAAVLAIISALSGPFAYTIQTISNPHTGPIPIAGPATSGSGFPGGFPGKMPRDSGNGQFPGSPDSTNQSTGKNQQSGFGNFAGGKMGGPGGFAAKPGKNIVQLLKENASDYSWVASAVGANAAAPYQLATGEPMMDIGGFTGSDPTPTLSQFKKYVKEGKIHYFIGGGKMGPGRGLRSMEESSNGSNANQSFGRRPKGDQSGTSGDISNWVESNFKAQTVDGVTIYDLTEPQS